MAELTYNLGRSAWASQDSLAPTAEQLNERLELAAMEVFGCRAWLDQFNAALARNRSPYHDPRCYPGFARVELVAKVPRRFWWWACLDWKPEDVAELVELVGAGRWVVDPKQRVCDLAMILGRMLRERRR